MSSEQARDAADSPPKAWEEERRRPEEENSFLFVALVQIII